MKPYRLLDRLFPTRPAPGDARRIVLILPCCIGDVILATAALKGLRRAFPQAHITWAVGSWSRGVVEQHPLLDAVLDTGPAALPVYSPAGLLRFSGQLRAGAFDLAVSLVRSPLMSLAVGLAGIPWRAGLDSAGRGFGYNLRAHLDPQQPRHEAEIYLDVLRALGLDVSGCWANVPVHDDDRRAVAAILAERGIVGSFFVVNPCGGRNPGMVMDSKRWPPAHFADLTVRLESRWDIPAALLGGPDDAHIVEAVAGRMGRRPVALIGALTFGQIAALASMARLYIGNDTGVTHLAAAAGAPTAMILGPSDPARYRPFTPASIALWQPTAIQPAGVAAGPRPDWDWQRDGIGVDAAEREILNFSQKQPKSPSQ